MRIVAISDIHGHFKEMMEALSEADFKADDPEELLVVCGDCFDRGDENLKVFEFLSNIPNKVIIRGNHEGLLREYLTEKEPDQLCFYNGTYKTLVEFLSRKDGTKMDKEEMDKAINELYLPFLDSTVDYFETEKYIFVHGWLPYSYDDSGKPVLVDYKKATDEQWLEARWTSWANAIDNDLLHIGGDKKTVVICGHYSTREAYYYDDERSYNDNGIFRFKNLIAIDGCVMLSGKINVLVLEDNLL